MNPLSSAACLALLTPMLVCAADADPFEGIYSTRDWRTGAETDVLRVQKFLNGEYHVFIREHTWSGPNTGKVGEILKEGRMPGPFPHDPRIVTLAVRDVGSLYKIPQGAFSRAGRSQTGYLSHMVQLGAVELTKRPLLTSHQVRWERGVHDYRPTDADQKIAVSTLNYSDKKIQVGVSDASDKTNAVDTDPLDAYMSSVAACCFYLPKDWNASLRVNVEYRSLADGKLKIVPLAVPKYDGAQKLWVAVLADGRMELSFPNSYEEDYRQRTMPAPPPSEVAVIKANNLKRIKGRVADLSSQLKKMSDVSSEFRGALRELRQEERYIEVLNACKQSRKECDSEAQSQASEVD